MITGKKKLTANEIKYGIMYIGNLFNLGCGETINVKTNSCEYNAKIDSKRNDVICGLSQLYNDLDSEPFDRFKLEYNENDNHIHLFYLWGSDYDNAPYKDITLRYKSTMFNGEYYTTPCQSFDLFCRSIAIYNNTYYFLYESNVISRKLDDKENHILIKNALRVRNVNYDCQQIYVNDMGIYVYNSFIDNGVICRLFNFDGKEIDSFSIDRIGKKKEKRNLIHSFSYIEDEFFYCISDNTYYIYDFKNHTNIGEYELELPSEKFHVTRLIVSNHQTYLRITDDMYCGIGIHEGHEDGKWVKLTTDSFLGKIVPLFKNCKSEIKFLHPKQNKLWIENYDSDTNIYTYRAYHINDGQWTGQEVKVQGTHNIVYFDGKIMYIRADGRIESVNLATGESTSVHALIPSKFLIYKDNLCILKDYGSMEQYISLIPSEFSNNAETKICDRQYIW